ncbi:TetR/AcrR family transcriptional regulator [Stenotrophomonas maltophilia]|uniref:TetR/AcrR family transcriptional regulator n=1 Tax=Stenotrophomonas maltophilia TaxID=40324 RepID=UPI0021BF7B87|nr:TetR/AcrR family transcriptional regulator [Stenotrophomonas maltophilia]UXL28945.1 TetR/AcrR family transcriptional regulator [Stenotrophomonas maltophilia]
MRETAALIVRNGRSSVTVDEILEYSKVSRGAMFHHFGCKQDLINATFSNWLQGFNHDVDQRMRKNGVLSGTFTGAYVDSVIEGCRRHDIGMLAALIIRLDLTQAPASQWSAWMIRKLAVVQGEVDDLELKERRLAVEGLWLNSLAAPTSPVGMESVYEYLAKSRARTAVHGLDNSPA